VTSVVPEPDIVGHALDTALPIGQKPASLRRDTVRNVLRQRTAIIGLGILGFLVFVALFADLIAPYPPNVSMLDLGQPGTRGAPPASTCSAARRTSRNTSWALTRTCGTPSVGSSTGRGCPS
jgi:hypothetical protein